MIITRCSTKQQLNPYQQHQQNQQCLRGPTVQENYGKGITRPTFQDLIKSPYDEELFAFYGTTQLVKNSNGTEVKSGHRLSTAPLMLLQIKIPAGKKNQNTLLLHRSLTMVSRLMSWLQISQVSQSNNWLICHLQKQHLPVMTMYKLVAPFIWMEWMMNPQLWFGVCHSIAASLKERGIPWCCICTGSSLQYSIRRIIPYQNAVPRHYLGRCKPGDCIWRINR